MNWLPATSGVLTLVLIAGCASDSRINVSELQELQQAARPEPLAAFDPTAVSLTDLQPYRVQHGDVLALTLTGLEADYAKTQVRARVHESGAIDLPLVGDVSAAGLTLAQVEQRVEDAYVPDYVKRLSVFIEPLSTADTTVFVVGAAAAPGVVTLPKNERNVLYAVQRAGGFGPGSSRRIRVEPIDEEGDVITYDLSSVVDLRRALTAAPLQSGDLVFVEPAEYSQIFVTGLVTAPGPVPLPADSSLSVMRAISAAGGLIDFLDPAEATLWRRLDDGNQVRVKLDLRKIRSGQQEDVLLAAGDILEIPHTLDTRAREWFAQNIQLGPFGVQAVYDPIADRRARIVADNNNGFFQRTFLNTFSTGLAELLVPPPAAP